jgi:hypothetical protein
MDLRCSVIELCRHDNTRLIISATVSGQVQLLVYVLSNLPTGPNGEKPVGDSREAGCTQRSRIIPLLADECDAFFVGHCYNQRRLIY